MNREEVISELRSAVQKAQELLKELDPPRTCGACGADIEAWDKTVQFEDEQYHEFCCE